LETPFHKENVGENLSFAMMTKKIDIFFGGGQTGQNPIICGNFCRSSNIFCQLIITNRLKVAQQLCYVEQQNLL